MHIHGKLLAMIALVFLASACMRIEQTFEELEDGDRYTSKASAFLMRIDKQALDLDYGWCEDGGHLNIGAHETGDVSEMAPEIVASVVEAAVRAALTAAGVPLPPPGAEAIIPPTREEKRP